MKKINFKIYILITVLIIFLVAVVLYVFLSKINNRDKLLIGNNKLDNNYFEICELSSNKKIFSNFEEIKYLSKNKKMYSLNDAISDNIVTIDYILSKGEIKNELNDGGTLIYTFNNNFSNKNIVIVKCNRAIDIGSKNNIQDIYILDYNPEKQFEGFDNICKER